MAETQTDALSGIDTNAFQSAMKLGLRPGSKEFWAHFGLLRRMSPDYAHLKTDQELDWTDYFLDELSGGKHLKEYNDLGAQQRKVLDLYSAMQAHTAQKQAESQVGAVPIPYSEGQAEVPPQAGAVLNAPQFQTGVERALAPSRLQAETALAPESAMLGLPDKGGRVPLQTTDLQATPPMIQPPGTNVWDVPALETRPSIAGRPAVPPMAAGFPVTPQGLELIKAAGAVQPQHLKEVLEMARGPQPENITYHQPGTLAVRGVEVLGELGQKPEKFGFHPPGTIVEQGGKQVGVLGEKPDTEEKQRRLSRQAQIEKAGTEWHNAKAQEYGYDLFSEAPREVKAKINKEYDAKGNQETRTKFNQAFKLRSQYNTDPTVKAVSVVEPIMEVLTPYMLERAKAGGPRTAVGDNTLLRAYLAATRGDGERLTNMQLQELAKLPGIGDRVTGWIQNLLVGKHLPDDTAKEMWGVISEKYRAMDDTRKKLRLDIIKRAERSFIDPGLIFGED